MASSSQQDDIEFIQESLEPYIKPREQVSHIRRILGLHLQSCTENSQPGGPLALVDESATTTVTKEVRGLERQYLKALAANVKAQQEFETVRKAHLTQPSGHSVKHGHSERVLEDQLVLIKLRQKATRLETLHKHLDILSQQPASSDEFLDLDSVFQDARPLPEVPKKIVDSFVNNGTGMVDLAGLAGQLDKVLLRSKLLLKREEQLLEEVKANSVIDPSQISDEARLHALDITRNELISWIETELSKASGEDDEDVDEDGNPEAESGGASKEEQKQKQVRKQISERLEEINEKYEHYVASRKALIVALGQSSTPATRPILEPPETKPAATLTVEPASHLLTPYLDVMLALSREQKGLISHKSHFNITLSKQLKEACQAVDHLAAESQLLPKFPMPGSQGLKRGGLLDDLSAGLSEKPDLSSRVKPWAIASDSAKIATLETVAEKVEEGQMAIEGSMAGLAEVDKLLGNVPRKEMEGLPGADEDIWLDTGKPSKKGETRRQVGKNGGNMVKPGDIWSVLDGSLGLIGQDDHS